LIGLKFGGGVRFRRWIFIKRGGGKSGGGPPHSKTFGRPRPAGSRAGALDCGGWRLAAARTTVQCVVAKMSPGADEAGVECSELTAKLF
jgi:hypothetical protein